MAVSTIRKSGSYIGGVMAGFFGGKTVHLEFEVEGRTYRVEVKDSVIYSNGLGGNHIERDLISGQEILVNWGLIPVFRILGR